jgi:hypothetical protein
LLSSGNLIAPDDRGAHSTLSFLGRKSPLRLSFLWSHGEGKWIRPLSEKPLERKE